MKRYVMITSVLVFSLMLTGCELIGVVGLERDISTYAASGTVLVSGGSDDGKPLAAVVITIEFLDEDLPELVTITQSSGMWQMDGLIGDVKITPSKAGYTFNPAYQVVQRQNTNVGFAAVAE